MKKLVGLLFTWGGRISRREYFIGLLLNSIIHTVFTWLIVLSLIKGFRLPLIIFCIIGRLISFYISITLIVKRLHDFGMEGANIFLLLIPFFNIYYFFKLLFKKGDVAVNAYGESRIYEKKMAVWSWIVVVIVLSVAQGVVGFSLLSGIVKNPAGFYQTMMKNPVVQKVMGWVSGIITNTDAYRIALQEIHTNPTIADIYGKFEVGSFPMGSVSINGSEGEASLQISLSGDKNNGTIYVDLQESGGKRGIVNMLSVDAQNNHKYIIENGTASPTDTSVITPGVYTSPLGFSLHYPSDRTVRENTAGSSVSFSTSAGASLSVMAVTLPDAYSGIMLKNLLTSQAQIWKDLPSATGISNTTVTIHGMKAEKVVYQRTQASLKYEGQQIYLMANNVEYTFSYVAPSDIFNSSLSSVNEIIQSFEVN